MLAIAISASDHATLATKTTKAMLKTENGDEENPAVYEKTENKIEAPGTNVKESVQDIVLEGGHHVVEDVVLTINQAIEPVEKGMTKIQETFHEIAVKDDEKESKVKVENHVPTSEDKLVDDPRWSSEHHSLNKVDP